MACSIPPQLRNLAPFTSRDSETHHSSVENDWVLISSMLEDSWVIHYWSRREFPVLSRSLLEQGRSNTIKVTHPDQLRRHVSFLSEYTPNSGDKIFTLLTGIVAGSVGDGVLLITVLYPIHRRLSSNDPQTKFGDVKAESRTFQTAGLQPQPLSYTSEQWK
ncbi:unnamed protein product [Rhizoctonia solani]|uniref:Uncharacterized protein n=1 Tax=Rhizoctonia solani TaxID=456999 RepID=A0A8H3A162_9AGAM|nr:unnamed protein product [Rhizoctonia solani]CAE6394304.1 unnamed protein product [Rhizoctonia solani]